MALGIDYPPYYCCSCLAAHTKPDACLQCPNNPYRINVIPTTAVPPGEMWVVPPRGEGLASDWLKKWIKVTTGDKPVDKTRYKWIKQDEAEKWLVDSNDHKKVVAIVSLRNLEETKTEWWGVYSPFKKKAISQHLNEKDATEYAEDHLAQGEKEERVSWEE